MRAALEKRLPFLLRLAERLVPESQDLDEAARAEFLGLVTNSLSPRAASIQLQLALFLSVLRWLPALRYGRPWDALPPAEQDAVLLFFQDAPLSLVRKGLWGVKTLVFMGYYGRPAVWGRLGYRPPAAGEDGLAGR